MTCEAQPQTKPKKSQIMYHKYINYSSSIDHGHGVTVYHRVAITIQNFLLTLSPTFKLPQNILVNASGAPEK